MLFLLACGVPALLGVGSAAEFTPTKKVDFVDEIKRNLKRNNDDYAEEEKNKLLNNSTRSNMSFAATATTDLPKSIKNEIGNYKNNTQNRRAGGANSWEFSYYETKTKDQLWKKIAINKSYHVKSNISRLNNATIDHLPKLKSTGKTISITNLSNDRNVKRINKFKKFMKKNKPLFKGFLGSQLQTNAVLKSKDKSLLKNEVKAAGRARASEEAQLPGPEVLDMAPARGGRIHRLRMKGRLCHRHVLLPEGPKYDSGGRWYVPEHRLRARRPYERTRAPRLLLPRCCNCCKKSVLGCE